MDDNSGMMMMMISMMIMSSCVSSSMSSGLFVAANENWLTGQLFDWMDMDWYHDVKSWFGFETNPPSTEPPGPSSEPPGGPSGSSGSPPTGNYKDNCVYLYSGKDAKSGYINTLCVDEKNTQKYWQDPKMVKVESMRIGKEVRAILTPGNHKINGSDITKPYNLDDKGYTKKAIGISLGYKQYNNSGLESVGQARDENSVYLYSDTKGKDYLDTVKSKSGNNVLYREKGLKRVNSIRIGKHVKIRFLDNPLFTFDGSKGPGVSQVHPIPSNLKRALLDSSNPGYKYSLVVSRLQ